MGEMIDVMNQLDERDPSAEAVRSIARAMEIVVERQMHPADTDELLRQMTRDAQENQHSMREHKELEDDKTYLRWRWENETERQKNPIYNPFHANDPEWEEMEKDRAFRLFGEDLQWNIVERENGWAPGTPPSKPTEPIRIPTPGRSKR